jgi:hypothetical protein
MTPISLGQSSVDPVALEKRFRDLEAEWNEATWFLSSPPAIVNHPAFRAIIALGPAVVPLMLRDLEQRPNLTLWVWALPEITGEDIEPDGDAAEAMMTRLARAWLRWGRERGLKW